MGREERQAVSADRVWRQKLAALTGCPYPVAVWRDATHLQRRPSAQHQEALGKGLELGVDGAVEPEVDVQLHKLAPVLLCRHAVAEGGA